MFRGTPFLFAGLLSALFPGSVSAEKVQDTRAICINQSRSYEFEEVRQACEAQIDAVRDAEALYEARISLGIAFGDRGDFQRSVAEFTEAIGLLPNETAAYNNRGIAFRNLGNFEAAIADYGEALRINPRSARTLNNRCWARAVTARDLELAIEDCNASLEIEVDANTYGTRCIVYLQLRQYQAALEDCDAAIKGSSQDARPLFGRGIARWGLGRVVESNEDIRAAVSLNESVAEEYASFGIVIDPSAP